MKKSSVIKIVAFLTSLTFHAEAQKTVNGVYKTNFPVLGFFGTSISFDSNGEFKYWHAGDLMSDQGAGKYKIIDGYVELHFDQEVQPKRYIEVVPDHTDSLGEIKAILLENPAKVSRPMKYKISGNKLFSIHRVTGKVVRREQGYSRIRKFLFWGDHFMTKRKHYLKKEKTKL